MTEIEIGTVRHFFDKIGVAAIDITADTLTIGDTIHIKGHTTDTTMKIETLRIEKDVITAAKAGDTIGTKITGKAREHDKVFKVTEP